MSLIRRLNIGSFPKSGAINKSSSFLALSVLICVTPRICNRNGNNHTQKDTDPQAGSIPVPAIREAEVGKASIQQTLMFKSLAQSTSFCYFVYMV